MAWTEKYVTHDAAGGGDGSSGSPWTLAEAIAAAVGGERINVKAGTYANTTTSHTFGAGGGAATTTAPKWWRGYTTVIGDLDEHPSSTRTAGTDFPLLTFTSGVMRVSDPHNIFSNLEVRGTAPGTHLFGCTGSKCKFVRCRFDCQEANGTSYTARIGGDGVIITNCWFKGTSSVNVVAISEEGVAWNGCVFRGGGDGLMLDTSGRSASAHDCIFDDNGDDAIVLVGAAGNNAIIEGCTIYSPGGHGINITTAAPLLAMIRNCLFHTITTASKYAINASSGTNVPHLAGNAYYNVTARTNNITEALEFFDITEGGDPLPNAASHDFALASDAESKGTALPQLFENESYKGWRDAGAVQREEPAGGGGGSVANLIGPGLVY